MYIWPPRDTHSQQIIRAANKDHTPDGPGGKRSMAAEEHAEEGEILPPDKKRSKGSPSNKSKNRRKRRSSHSDSGRRASKIDDSLVITVDGRGPPLLDGRGPPNDMYLPLRSPLLGTPPSGPQPYPREPHHQHHTPYERDSYGHGNYPSNEGQNWYSAPPPPPPWRRDTWHHNNPDSPSSPPAAPRDYREQLSRSLSMGEDHRHAPHHQRRYSEHYDRPLHDTIPPLMDATPIYSERGRMLSSNRGFRMSVQAAQGAGLYRGGRQSSGGHSHGQYR